MANKGHLTVVGGTETVQPYFVDGRPTGGLVATGIVDAEGNNYFKGPPGGKPPGNSGSGGDGDMKTPFEKLLQNVRFLNWAVGAIFSLGLVAIVSSFLILDGRINDRFDKLGDKVGSVQMTVSAQTATIDGMKRSLDKIEERLDDDKPQGSPGSGQAESVRQGTGSGGKNGR
jgi:hypothetical protein